jgi:hypothetical protein
MPEEADPDELDPAELEVDDDVAGVEDAGRLVEDEDDDPPPQPASTSAMTTAAAPSQVRLNLCPAAIIRRPPFVYAHATRHELALVFGGDGWRLGGRLDLAPKDARQRCLLPGVGAGALVAINRSGIAGTKLPSGGVR